MAAHVVHCLILGERAASEVGLIHLHWMRSWTHHVDQHTLAATAVRSSSSVRHAANEGLALETHSHLAHLVEVHLQRVDLAISIVVHHIVDAHLGFPPTLLRSHWQMVTLIHGILILALLAILSVTLLIRILHYFVHLNFVSHRWRRLRALHIMDSILLVNVIL